ncbi:hypothetical protein Axi01nite_86500 [Actinoplanes xinjiangensis]|nr:hypothetical protein Axi01nite_86500 [Actinoplanes xinjiangensis]
MTAASGASAPVDDAIPWPVILVGFSRHRAGSPLGRHPVIAMMIGRLSTRGDKRWRDKVGGVCGERWPMDRELRVAEGGVGRPTVDDGRPTTSDRRQATGDRQQATGNRRQATSDRQRATGGRRQAAGGRRRSTVTAGRRRVTEGGAGGRWGGEWRQKLITGGFGLLPERDREVVRSVGSDHGR